MAKKNKANAFAAAYAASEAHVRGKAEKRAAEVRSKACELQKEILQRYLEASDTRVRDECEKRYMRLVAELAVQDKIIAECLENLDNLSRQLERVLAGAVAAIDAEIQAAAEVAAESLAAVEKASNEEEEALAAIGQQSDAVTKQ